MGTLSSCPQDDPDDEVFPDSEYVYSIERANFRRKNIVEVRTNYWEQIKTVGKKLNYPKKVVNFKEKFGERIYPR